MYVDPENQLPIKRTSITEMCTAYSQALQQIEQGFNLIGQAENLLIGAFQPNYESTFQIEEHHQRLNFRDAKDLQKIRHKIKHAAWKVLVEKMGLRSIMGQKRVQELDAQLEGKWGSDCYGRQSETIHPLPEVTEVNVIAMMESNFNNLGNYLDENIKEVFDWLRPVSGWRLEYKTNQKSEFELQEKLILTGIIQHGYGNNRFQVGYHRQTNVTALDNVMHLLDGKGPVKTHYGPLSDAIQKSDGKGETDYFRFQCFGNGNLHLWFKRADMLAELNMRGSSQTLKGAKAA